MDRRSNVSWQGLWSMFPTCLHPSGPWSKTRPRDKSDHWPPPDGPDWSLLMTVFGSPIIAIEARSHWRTMRSWQCKELVG